MQKQLKLLKETNKRYKEHTIELRTKVLKVVVSTYISTLSSPDNY